MRSIAICSGNVGKRKECARILEREVESVTISLDEIQSLDCIEVCRRKAADAYRQLQRPVIVDDTGLSLESLGGFPGALIAWVLETGDAGLLHRMLPSGGSDAAIASTVIGYADVDGVEVFASSLRGRVLAEPRGGGGFGFDSIFLPDGYSSTLAEMSDAEKDACSPRGAALRALRGYLESRN